MILFVWILVALCEPFSCAVNKPSFKTKEEQGAGILIGNVVGQALPFYLSRDKKFMTADEIAALRFRFFGQGNLAVAYFKLNEESGDILTKQNIDRETICPQTKRCVLDLDVAAITSDRLVLIMPISVEIEDVNDNRPKFPQNIYKISIPESVAPNTKYPLPEATDDDSGTNSVQTYKLSLTNNKFALITTVNSDNSIDLQLEVFRSLDREKTSFYEMKLLALDGGIPQLTGAMTIQVNIADINDHRPVFNSTRYNMTVKEDYPIGKPLLTVLATDRDEGVNGRVFYSISDRTPKIIAQKFVVNQTTGVISLKKELDYEESKRYQLNIEASDQGPLIKQISQAVVIFYVIDVNDHAPKINFNFLSINGAELSEYSKPGQFIAHVSVRDSDSGLNAQVFCTMKNTLEFKLQHYANNEFQIFLNATLDRERISSYDVKVMCRDRGVPLLSSVSTFKVSVLDENDNHPKFARSVYFVSIYENNPPNQILLHLNATDADIGNNAALSYAVVQNTYGIFSIDPKNGILRVNSVLNREALSSFDLVIEVRDQGSPSLSASTSVKIKVLDINDVTPYFKDKFSFEITEESNVPKILGLVKAFDEDTGINKKINYYVHHNYSNKFVIYPESGELRVVKKLDREERSVYHLPIIAKDFGNPALTGTGTVTIKVKDINDNYPIFQFPSKKTNSVEMNSTESAGNVVCQIFATDSDDGDNGLITYRLDTKLPFLRINPKTGVIRLREKLVLSNSTSYIVHVFAEDNGYVRRNTRSYFRLNVLYINTTYLDLPSDHTTTSSDDERDSSNNNVAIVVSVVVVTVLLVAIIISIICIVLWSKRWKRTTHESEVDPTPFNDPDVVKTNGQNCYPKKKALTSNADLILEGKITDDSHSLNGYISSYDPASCLTFKWPDDHENQRLNQLDPGKKLGDQTWKENHHGHRDDAYSDVSENTVTSDSGKGGSEEGSARGQNSMEEPDAISKLRNLIVPDGHYIDMSGSHSKTSSPQFDQSSKSDYQLGPTVNQNLTHRQHFSSDMDIYKGKPSNFSKLKERYPDSSLNIINGPHIKYPEQNGSPRNHPTNSNVNTNSLDRTSKYYPPCVNSQLSHPGSSFQHRNPYTEYTSSSQFENSFSRLQRTLQNNSNNNNALPGILSKRTSSSMPFRFKNDVPTPPPRDTLAALDENDGNKTRTGKCVRFNNTKSPLLSNNLNISSQYNDSRPPREDRISEDENTTCV